MATVTADRRVTGRPRSGWRIAQRAAILLPAIALAIVVVRIGAANRLSQSKPFLAAQMAPWNARAALDAARAASKAHPLHPTPKAMRFVDAALDRSTTDPAALEFKALQAAAAGDHRREARLIALSSLISRRSLPTRLWLIQHAVDRGHVADALEQFDVALRTSTDAPPILFPALTRASADPGLAAPIARLLDRSEDWHPAFLHFAIAQPGAGIGMGRVLLHMRDRRWIVSHHFDDALVARLIDDGQFLAARRVQDSFHPDRASGLLVRDPRFADGRVGYPFGWDLIQTGEIAARRAVANGRPVLRYQTYPGGAGQVASQLLILSPGAYRFAVRTASAPSDASIPPFWTITCAEDGGPQIALLEQPNMGNAAAAVNFTVPKDCQAQWIALSLRESDEPNGTFGAIAGVAVTRR